MIKEIQIKQCAAQDRTAQKEIYEQLYGKMLSVCKRYVSDEETAKDLVNMGFVKVFKSIDKFSFKGSFEGWVRRIMVNISLDQIKDIKMRDSLFLRIEDVEEETNLYEYNEAIDKLHINDLLVLINSLSPISKAVFNMYVIDGYSHKEIAEELNISVGTSKWHVSTARKYLQTEIDKQHGTMIRRIV